MSSDALKAMIDKLDNRGPGREGYTTHIPEIIAILGELTNSVPAVVLERPANGMDVSVMIKIGFTIGRDEL